ncbi:MAG: alcohol dehydrogenase catalytic domain-containing protein [Armatimonadota bacterium]|nr:alcohol dehydrogenase catalytic domain-containing protein [Armatimonadota bacterium]
MTQTLEQYRAAQGPLPEKIKRWHLHGAGLESLHEVTIDLPTYGPDELLVRHDACGICFSDIKIINLGPQHPRLQGRDMAAHPVVMGHEVALTVAGVGENLRGQFQVGQRFIVQADVYYKGYNPAYGYQLDGGMAQYGVVTKEVLQGDEGCYLLPLEDTTGYVEAALVEPWACVVAAYAYPNYRDGLLADGRLLIVHVNPDLYRAGETPLYPTGYQPSNVVAIEDAAGTDFARLRQEETDGKGFDDIVVYGTPAPEDLTRVMGCLGPRGILNLVRDKPLQGTVPIDVGRVHYEQHLFVSTGDPAKVQDAYTQNTRKELLPGGKTWLAGAGGPMGQMHLQRATMLDAPPSLIVVSDRHDARLERIQARFGGLMQERGIELVLLNVKTGGDPTVYGPFDDILSMVPSTDLIVESLPHLAENGVYNIFAGVAKGVTAELDLGTILAKNQRLIGTSGSSIADLRHTLELVESDTLSTNASLAAIGGLAAFRDGLSAVKSGRFPGKTVIFPHIENLPLLSIDDLQTQLPNVYAKLQDGVFWTQEAEEELLREKLG